MRPAPLLLGLMAALLARPARATVCDDCMNFLFDEKSTCPLFRNKDIQIRNLGTIPFQIACTAVCIPQIDLVDGLKGVAAAVAAKRCGASWRRQAAENQSLILEPEERLTIAAIAGLAARVDTLESNFKAYVPWWAVTTVVLSALAAVLAAVAAAGVWLKRPPAVRENNT